MSDLSIFPVEVEGIALIDTLHDLGQRDVPGFHQQVDVIAHEDIGVEGVMIAVFVYGEVLVIFIVIRDISKYLLPLISTGDDMIEGTFVFYAGFSSHERKIAGSAKIVNMSIPKSDPRLLFFIVAISFSAML